MGERKYHNFTLYDDMSGCELDSPPAKRTKGHQIPDRQASIYTIHNPNYSTQLFSSPSPDEKIYSVDMKVLLPLEYNVPSRNHNIYKIYQIIKSYSFPVSNKQKFISHNKKTLE